MVLLKMKFKKSTIKICIGITSVFLLIVIPLVARYIKISRCHQMKNILYSGNISWGKGWTDVVSNYGGSEFIFSFANSEVIKFSALSPNKEYGQGIIINIDDEEYVLENPGLNKKELSIQVDKNKPHKVRVRHFCSGSKEPCKIRIKSIQIGYYGKLLKPPDLPSKSLVILGDSITVGKGRFNYSFLLADNLDVQLRNAGVFGSTVSRVKGVDSVLDRYKRDIGEYSPDMIIVFLGTNDLGHNVQISDFEKDYRRLLLGLKKSSPGAKILTLGLLYRFDFSEYKIKQYNSIIKKISEDLKIKYIDMYNSVNPLYFSDGIHPSIIGHRVLAKFLEDRLHELDY